MRRFQQLVGYIFDDDGWEVVCIQTRGVFPIQADAQSKLLAGPWT
jgi:hypothetical protein